MGVHTKRFCLRGHDTSIKGRRVNGGCRECAVMRDRGEIAPVASVPIPFAPLEAWLLACGSPQIFGDNIARYFYRWRDRGIPLYTADRICCEILGVHPHQVFGDAWFSFGEEALE
jgi:hypothetical protein